MLNILDSVGAAGNPSRVNEDRFGFSGNYAWVIDGATDLATEPFLPGASDVQWLVDRVGQRLHLRGEGKRAYPGAAHLLRELSSDVSDDMKSLGFPPDRIHPTCSIGFLHVDVEKIELARIGDPSCLAFGDRIVELSTGFFGRREAQAVKEAKNADLSDDSSRSGILKRRQDYIRGVFEESVFSGHPEARLRIHVESLQTHRVKHVILCTDGFARAVVDYRIYADWHALLEGVLTSGLQAVVDRIRAYEVRAEGATHFKRSDDATALLISI
jgi:hypothetical protein